MGNKYNIKQSAKYEVLALITGSKKESIKKYFNRGKLSTEDRVDIGKFIFKFVIKRFMKDNKKSLQLSEDQINNVDDFVLHDIDDLEEETPTTKKEKTEEEEENEREVRKTIATPVIQKKRRAITM